MTKKCSLLGICNELAIGAKHFEQTRSKPLHVQDTGSVWSRYVEKGYIASGYFKERESLCVYLEPPTSQKLGFGGPYVDAFSLAIRVLEFWRNKGGF